MQKDFERNEIKKEEWLEKRLFTINYETRTSSSDWLFEISRAYVADNCNSNKAESSRLKDRNSDYYHLLKPLKRLWKYLPIGRIELDICFHQC